MGPAPGAHHGRALGFGVLVDRGPVDVQLPGDCPNGEAPKLSLLHGLPPNPLSRRGFPAWRCRRLANSAVAVQCGAGGLDDAEGCQALLGVVAHAVDSTVKAGAISERTIGSAGCSLDTVGVGVFSGVPASGGAVGVAVTAGTAPSGVPSRAGVGNDVSVAATEGVASSVGGACVGFTASPSEVGVGVEIPPQ